VIQIKKRIILVQNETLHQKKRNKNIELSDKNKNYARAASNRNFYSRNKDAHSK